jgi:hypothetical protein
MSILKPFAIPAMSIAMMLPAYAKTLTHKEVLGTWCMINDTESVRARKNEDCGDSIMIIKPDRYEGWEHGCIYTDVVTWFDGTISVATKTPLGAPVSRIKSGCAGEGCTWREEMTVYFAKGVLFTKNRRHSAEKCEG